MKTALQELLEDIQINNRHYYEANIVWFKSLLEKNKQEIIDAYHNAEDKWEYFQYEHRYGREHLTGEDYYNEKYNENEIK